MLREADRSVKLTYLVPFKWIFSSFPYDAFGNITQRSGFLWRTAMPTDPGTYTNNRRSDLSYDQAGDLNGTEHSNASYDSTRQRTYAFTTQTDEFPTGARMFNSTITQSLDGDGWLRGRTEYRYVEQTINDEFDYTEATATQHFLWSSVLGAVVAELDEDDELSKAFVFAGQRLASLEITPSTSAVYFRNLNPKTGTTYRTDHNGKGGRHEEFDPLGAQIPKIDPYITNFRLYSDLKPPGKLFMNDASPYAYDNSCSWDGIPTPCAMVQRFAESGAGDIMVEADVYIRYGSGRIDRHSGKVSSALAGINQVWRGRAAQVAANGFYSALQGGLEAAINAAFRNVYIWQNDRLPEGSVRNYAHAAPQNTGTITDAELNSANNLIDKNYDKCRKLLGANDPEAPGREGAGLALAAAQNNVDDATMIGAIWQHESGINTIDYYGDAGPAQLTSWWKNNQPQLIVGNAYGTWHGRLVPGRDYSFDGSVQDNVATLRNIVRFSRDRYGSNYMTAYWYGPGYTGGGTKAFKAAQARINRTSYANNVSRIYNKYLPFFNCLVN